jgi:hypothetical protein
MAEPPENVGRDNCDICLPKSYQIGFIGYWSVSDHRYVYVLENAKPDKTLIASAEFKIHSAFTRYLEPTE